MSPATPLRIAMFTGPEQCGVAHYTAQLERAAFDRGAIRALVQDYVPRMDAFEPAYVEEMRGIAEGARLEFEDVALLNARTEILKLGLRPDLRRRLAADDEACTGVVALPEATEGRRLIHAQNWDWKVECAATAVVLCVRRDDGPDLLTSPRPAGSRAPASTRPASPSPPTISSPTATIASSASPWR